MLLDNIPDSLAPEAKAFIQEKVRSCFDKLSTDGIFLLIRILYDRYPLLPAPFMLRQAQHERISVPTWAFSRSP